MDEEKERPQYHSEAVYGAQQEEIKEKLESEGLDPDEFDEDEQPACAEASAGIKELTDFF